MNEYENDENPYDDKREAIGIRERIAVCVCPPDEKILERGKQIQQAGIKSKDALNLACAIERDTRISAFYEGKHDHIKTHQACCFTA